TGVRLLSPWRRADAVPRVQLRLPAGVRSRARCTSVEVLSAVTRQRFIPLLKTGREPVVAHRPISLEAGCCRKVCRGALDIVPVLLIELPVPPLQPRAFEEAQHRTG